jgi:hypothetical protein
MQLKLNQPAIVFWIERPGEITRFERLRDAIRAVMRTQVTTNAPVAWISTMDRHLTIEEIRQLARGFSLSWRLSQVGMIERKKDKKEKRFWSSMEAQA